jgi:hypothetical protein
VGTGGLGSPAALYLAAAGIGRLGLVDGDVVDETNLHRQILFKTADVGASKVRTAAEALRALNPTIEVVEHAHRLTTANVADVLAGYDVIVDGTDNFPTRYLVNDACVRLGKPDVWASIYRFMPGGGRVTAACSRPSRPTTRSPLVRKLACWACCPACSGPCRPPKPSSSCWASGAP